MPLSVKQKNRLHKKYVGLPLVVIYTDGTEESKDFVPLVDIRVSGQRTLEQVFDHFDSHINLLNKRCETLEKENAELHKTIKHLLNIKE